MRYDLHERLELFVQGKSGLKTQEDYHLPKGKEAAKHALLTP